MTRMTVGPNGQLMLPPTVQAQYGLQLGAAVRTVETRGVVLLVPLTNEPLPVELAQELAQWQELGAGHGGTTFHLTRTSYNGGRPLVKAAQQVHLIALVAIGYNDA